MSFLGLVEYLEDLPLSLPEWAATVLAVAIWVSVLCITIYLVTK